MTDETDTTLIEAEFDVESIIKYRWAGLVPLASLIVTIPIVLVVAIVYALVLRRVVGAWSATLTARSLIVRKGVWTKTEKTIPLEKITDLGSTQGPIMRFFGLKMLTVETAGQSGGAEGGSLVSLIGVRNTDGFRKQVLRQRDVISSVVSETPPRSSEGDSDRTVDELSTISATLQRIESTLSQMASKSDADRG